MNADGGEPEHSAVMAGFGVDAMTMEETDDNLKDKIGSARTSWPPPRRWADCR